MSQVFENSNFSKPKPRKTCRQNSRSSKCLKRLVPMKCKTKSMRTQNTVHFPMKSLYTDEFANLHRFLQYTGTASSTRSPISENTCPKSTLYGRRLKTKGWHCNGTRLPRKRYHLPPYELICMAIVTSFRQTQSAVARRTGIVSLEM